MIFGKVAGTVVSTHKSDTTEGAKYLLVQLCNQRGEKGNGYLVALDDVGAGLDELVIARLPVAAAPKTIFIAASSLSHCTKTLPSWGIRRAMYAVTSFCGVMG